MNSLFDLPPVSISVTDLNRYLHQLLESDEILRDVLVFGEISNFSRASSGHVYFTLKDKNAAIRCVIWRNTAVRLKMNFKDGMAVEVHGYVNIYEAGGQVEITVDLIRLSGEGDLYQEFLRLKNRLEVEGLFDAERKRPIPDFPDCIGIVTSPSGAALQDMLNTIRRRFPLAEVILSPTLVQGEEAPLQIVAAIERLNRIARPDVILLARGGGSLEDLWAFNDERVARAIVASKAPIISGIGHETDFTISDFAADLRAPTPTAAAELATPDQAELKADLKDEIARLGKVFEKKIQEHRWQFNYQSGRLKHLSPLAMIQNDRQRVDEWLHRGQMAINSLLELQRTRLEGTQNHLENLSPMAVLDRGYAIVTSQGGKGVIRSIHQTEPGDALWVQVKDGKFGVEVTKKELEEQKEANA